MDIAKVSRRFGIRIVVVSFLVMSFAYVPGTNLVGLFVNPLAQEFGVSRTDAAWTVTFGLLASMGGSLIAGKILSRYPLQKTMGLLLTTSALAYLGLSFSTSITMSYLFSALRGFSNTVSTAIPISIIINNWYAPTTRGRALGIAMVGSGFGVFVLNLATGYLIENYSWRNAYQLYALLTILLVPLVITTFYRTPEERGLTRIGMEHQSEAASSPDTGIDTKSALQSPTFWLLFVSFMLICGSTMSLNANGAAFLGDLGFSSAAAAQVLSFTSFGLIFGKLLLGYICDKRGTRFGAVISISFIVLPYILFISAIALPWLSYVAVPLMGIGMAVNTVTQPLTVGEVFGKKDYGTLVGFIQIGSSLGSSFLPLVISSIYDATGSYLWGWVLICCLLCVALTLNQLAHKVKKTI